jgi:2-oxoglutarate dehydrogenase E2 component (dihydrolipoamide succinyltransferase)
MSVELRVPSVGESITEVQIGDWLKQQGQRVAADEALVVIETDKVTVELPSPAAGVITQMLKKKGEKARVGEVIGYLEAGAAPASPPPPLAGKAAPKSQGTVEPKLMPSARRVLAEQGLDPAHVRGSGPGGRVLKEDALAAAAGAAATAPASRPTQAPAKEPAGLREELVPMTPMRKRIAERLVQAQQTAAILTTFNEVDMGAVMELRQRHQQAFQAKHGVKLGFMSLFVKAAVEALKLVPQVNAEIRGESIVFKNYFDIGIAVGGGKGLVVPVLRGAERLSLAEIELQIADFAARARDNKLTLEELGGGTFTISNGGIYGSLLSTPILNPPQSGILGLHAIQERPVARDGAVVIRPMMYVALSYDHRLVDGREAVTFLKRVKECVEAPERILLEA